MKNVPVGNPEKKISCQGTFGGVMTKDKRQNGEAGMRLFNKYVMLEQQEKGEKGTLILPEDLKEETRQRMCDVVVLCIGDAVANVKVGDKVIIGRVPPQCISAHPEDGRAVYIVQEDMIQGAVK